MAIVLKSKQYDLKIDSNTIIGVMGKEYDTFLSSLTGADVFYLDKKMCGKNVIMGDTQIKLLDEYDLKSDLFNKDSNKLSHSEQRLLKYIHLVLSNKRVIVIDEPFLDLDSSNQKKIRQLINKLIKKGKTVIIGSANSNIIYGLCKKLLFIKDKDYYYGDITSFENKNILKKYDIITPDLVQFVNLTKDKKIKLRYSYDIRDLIKDVYRNVSQK